ncbi:MAG: D-Ala-D-Ala carboxypeptidase family metallohydrolase [Terrimicrobiaceae bacterium]|nr:D-Ala-D-Ala carboxypeptidase family metallohydrolase [Terrimicrobiaceae bacterium]
MGLIFCAGAGMLAGADKADAMWSVLDVLHGESGRTSDRLAVPPSMRGVVGYNGEAYRKFLGRMGLRKISVQQIMDSHAKAHGRVHNTLPPRQYWANIRTTLLAVDKVCDRLGEPVGEVVSVYRSPAYNATCPGAKSHSYHLRNNAIDMKFHSSPRKVAAMARDMRKAGLFKGGVGRYPGFTHLDTRGSNADW